MKRSRYVLLVAVVVILGSLLLVSNSLAGAKDSGKKWARSGPLSSDLSRCAREASPRITPEPKAGADATGTPLRPKPRR